MKKVFLLVNAAVILFLLASCSSQTGGIYSTEPETTEIIYKKADDETEMKAVWISLYELSMKGEDDKSEAAFTAKIDRMFKNISDSGFNTAFVHVRPNSDAFYRSEIYPFTSYLSGKQGVDPGYDALEIMCSIGNIYGIKIHAWINPFRVTTSTDTSNLSDDNPAMVILNDDNPDNDKIISVIDEGIYFNPTVPEAHEMILDGIREIVENYDVAGIHIDDYFYPTTDTDIDAVQYDEYISEGGTLSLDDWRRVCVSSFISNMYDTVKAYSSSLIVSISPTGNIRLNKNSYYADVEEWCSVPGYCDIMIPQVYFGFEHEKNPFESTAYDWSNIAVCPDVKLVYGLAIYKSGDSDGYAGTGSEEWRSNSDIIARQVEFIRQQKRYDGFVLYSYSYAFGENCRGNAETEMINLKSLME